MKNLFIIIAYIFLLASCKVNEQNQIIFEVGKSITEKSLKQIYGVDIIFEKDSIYLAGTFAKEKIKKIIGKKVSQILTNQGEIKVDNLNFFADLYYNTPHPDSSKIILIYIKK